VRPFVTPRREDQGDETRCADLSLHPGVRRQSDLVRRGRAADRLVNRASIAHRSRNRGSGADPRPRLAVCNWRKWQFSKHRCIANPPGDDHHLPHSDHRYDDCGPDRSAWWRPPNDLGTRSRTQRGWNDAGASRPGVICSWTFGWWGDDLDEHTQRTESNRNGSRSGTRRWVAGVPRHGDPAQHLWLLELALPSPSRQCSRTVRQIARSVETKKSD
jgi:hypothetical protein